MCFFFFVKLCIQPKTQRHTSKIFWASYFIFMQAFCLLAHVLEHLRAIFVNSSVIPALNDLLSHPEAEVILQVCRALGNICCDYGKSLCFTSLFIFPDFGSEANIVITKFAEFWRSGNQRGIMLAEPVTSSTHPHPPSILFLLMPTIKKHINKGFFFINLQCLYPSVSHN